jgi:putative endonuclease
MKGASSHDERRELGRRGEELAARRLEAEGYRILARNYRCPAGEVDLVAEDGECLVFVEVRTRHGDLWGTPEESVTRPKQARLVEVAQSYLAEREAWDVDWRVDVVAIDLDAHGLVRRLEIVRNAVSL